MIVFAFGSLGFGEIAVIVAVILVLFGGERVPEIAKALGKGIHEFKKALNEVRSQDDDSSKN